MNGKVTYERKNFHPQGSDCFEICWTGLVLCLYSCSMPNPLLEEY